MILTAGIVRLVYLLSYSHSPFFQVPLWDADDYHRMALALSGGHLDADLVFRPPLYPVLLGIVYIIFGAGSWMPRLFQLALGVWSCVLVQRMTGRLFSERWGLAAGLLAALTGLMVYFDMELLPTTLEVFLELLFLNELLRDPTELHPWRAGILLGLGALARPMILTFFPIAFLWFAGWRLGGHSSALQALASRPNRTKLHLPYVPLLSLVFNPDPLKRLLRFSAGFGIPLFASLLLHIAAGAGPVLVSAQGGVNFYIGSHPSSDGMTANFPGIGAGWSWDTVRKWAENRAGKPLDAAAADKLFWAEGWREIGRDPAKAIRKFLRKAGLFWNRVEISNNRDLYYHAREFPGWGWMLQLGFPLFLPLALAGIAFHWRDASIRLLTLFLLIYFFTVITFFVNARFRHPLTPVMIILAMGGLSALFALLRERRLKPALPVLAALTVGIWLPFAVSSGIDTHRGDYGLFTEGVALEKLGRRTEAAKLYYEALKVNPRAPFVNFNLAETAREQRNYREAAELYRKELEIQPRYSKAWNNLGVVWQELGNDEQALACFMQAATAQPGLPEAALNAARIWGRWALDAAGQGDWAQAVELARQAADLAPDEPHYTALGAEMRRLAGDTAGLSSGGNERDRRHPAFKSTLNP